MRKLSFLILALLLLASVLTACAGLPSEISANKEKEIAEAWLAQKGSELKWYGSSPMGMRYYGTYHDYDILFYPYSAVLDAPGSQIIAGEVFRSGSPFILYAYRDGAFHELETVYADDLINDVDIAQIAEMHQKYEAL